MNPLAELYRRGASFLRLKRSQKQAVRMTRMGIAEVAFGPTSLNLMMADVCNSQCKMCGHDYRVCGSGDILTLEKVRAIYDHLSMHNMVDVIYGGGGEPFLNPELADIAELTHRTDPVIQHTVISNMIASQPQTVARLLSSRVHFLISINAASRETYADVAGVDAFDAVIANTREVLYLRRQLKARSDISLSIILMRRNIEELQEFVKLGAEMGVNSVKALYVRVYPESYRARSGRGLGIRDSDSLYFGQEHSDRIMREAAALAAKLGIGFNASPLFAEGCAHVRDCLEPWRSLYIDTHGRVYPCAASEIHFKRKVEGDQYNTGNILQTPWSMFWNNPFWQSLRRTNSLTGREEIVPECLCCGMSLDWKGPGAKDAHIMDWTLSEKSDLRL